ncbi:MAG: DUF2911 domain-containing protein [Chitinophagaceae bacterium]|nr:DUF2911 domain-containing protein [Chitinophagaceae bacterium]
MKKLLLLAVMLGGLYFTQAQQLRTPAPSPSQNIKQEFGLSNIELSYSRPAKKGRDIFGDLVPYGKIWRTGANNATNITFGDDVIIGGTTVKAGKYGLLTIPGASEWTIIISKQTDVTGPADYKQDMDAVRVTSPAQSLPFAVENFTIDFGNISSNNCELWLYWDQTFVTLPIKTEIDSRVMTQIDNLMNKDNKPYFGAAMYYMDNGKDLNKALEWFDKAITQNPNAFWVWHQKANCLAKLGKKQDAIVSAKKSIELATAAKNNDYVELNNKLLKTLN